MTHPSDLWKEPTPGFQIVRPMGMETMHMRRETEDAALCGLTPAGTSKRRWSVYPKLPAEAPYCEACWVAWGKLGLATGILSKTTIRGDAAWPFPVVKP